jgi:hypothetical protein
MMGCAMQGASGREWRKLPPPNSLKKAIGRVVPRRVRLNCKEKSIGYRPKSASGCGQRILWQPVKFVTGAAGPHPLASVRDY